MKYFDEHPNVWQFLKFCIVGVSNTGVYLGTYCLLLYLGTYYLLANIVGFIVSVFNAYIWSKKYVFKPKQKSNTQILIRTYTAYGCTTLVSTCLIYGMVEYMGISKYVAPLISLLITIPLNFVLNKFWSFK